MEQISYEMVVQFGLPPGATTDTHRDSMARRRGRAKVRPPTPFANIVALRAADLNADLTAKLSWDDYIGAGSTQSGGFPAGDTAHGPMSSGHIAQREPASVARILQRLRFKDMYVPNPSSCVCCRRLGLICDGSPCRACIYFKTECRTPTTVHAAHSAASSSTSRRSSSAGETSASAASAPDVSPRASDLSPNGTGAARNLHEGVNEVGGDGANGSRDTTPGLETTPGTRSSERKRRAGSMTSVPISNTEISEHSDSDPPFSSPMEIRRSSSMYTGTGYAPTSALFLSDSGNVFAGGTQRPTLARPLGDINNSSISNSISRRNTINHFDETEEEAFRRLNRISRDPIHDQFGIIESNLDDSSSRNELDVPREITEQIGHQLMELEDTLNLESSLVHAVEEVGTFSGEQGLSRKDSQTVVATALVAALSIMLDDHQER